MKSEFPLLDVIVKRSDILPFEGEVVFNDDARMVNQNEFLLKVPGVGTYYANNGNSVEYSSEPGADPEWVKLHLNGQVLVALLHQRRIINFHASSFIYNGMGIMILGETGAGKSSLTAAFTLNGAGFLTDDMTPVVFRDSVPHIWPVYSAIKIDENTADQLKIGNEKLSAAETGTGKYYLKTDRAGVEEFPLHTIFKIETGKNSSPEFHLPEPAEKFSLLRSEICSWDILAGMPETEAEYLGQLVRIVEQARVVRVVRPGGISVKEMYGVVKEFLER